MALKVELKPGERFILGECVITNADQRTRLVIEGEAPILRGKDIVTTSQANTPAKRLYLAIQLMYMARDPRAHHDVYFALMRDILQAALLKILAARDELLKALRETLENIVDSPALPEKRTHKVHQEPAILGFELLRELPREHVVECLVHRYAFTRIS